MRDLIFKIFAASENYGMIFTLMHWHIFPRRNGDTPKPGPVWQVQDMNDDRYLPSAEKLEELKSSLRKELDLLCK